MSTDFLSIRSAIGGPAPAPSYAGLVRSVMRYRQKRVYWLAFAGGAVLIPLATFPVTGFSFLLAWLYPTTWLFLTLGWVSTLPIFVARKQYISAHPFSYTNQFTAYRTSLFSRKARVMLAAYILAAVVYLISFALIITWLQPARSYLPLTRTAGRDLISINERFVYLQLPVLVTTIGYAARQIVNGRETLQFDGPQDVIATRLRHRLLSQSTSLPSLALSSNVTCLGLYLLFKRTILRILIYRLPGGIVLRPLLLSMLRANHVTASVILTAFAASLAHMLILELANSLVDVYFTQHMLLSAFSNEPRRSLIDGIQSSDAYIKRFAYAELSQLCLTDAARRADIFSDIKHHAYDTISKTCLVELGQSYRNLQRRGRPKAPPVSTMPASAGATQPSAKDASSALIIRESAFKPTVATMVERLATGSIFTPPAIKSPALPQLPPAVVKAATAAFSEVPQILQQQLPGQVAQATALVKAKTIQAEQAASQAKGAMRKVEKTAIDWWQALTPASVARSAGFQHLFRPQLSADLARCLPNADVDKAAVNALGALVMASLHEDQYGVVQGDIAKIVEAFVLYMDAVEAYIVELQQAIEKGQYAKAVVEESLSLKVVPLKQALQSNTIGILRTFEPYLHEVKFPQLIASRLEPLLRS